MMISCQPDTASFSSVDDYPTAIEESLWLDYSPESTVFKLWSPAADQVMINLYESGNGGEKIDSLEMTLGENGIWSAEINGDLNNTYYTFQVLHKGVWLDETPGTYAQAVGVNGQRAMIIDLASTDPKGWAKDKGPVVKVRNEAVIYELHIRDLTIHQSARSSFPGKYLGLVEEGTKGPSDVLTAIDHIKELGVTHVHLLPTYDHYAIDETRLDSPQYNWGYDPQNYNVPEGSFSEDPFNAEVRIKEFKQMVKTFHDNESV